MKKSYVVIGMGRFGTSVAERLYELGNEVLVIDTNPDKVQRMEPRVTCAVVADARDGEVLRSVGARSCDCAVVAIGSDLATCIIATLNLKDLGVPQVICKATDELRKFLFANVYTNSEAKREDGKSKAVIAALFEYFSEHPEKMPELYYRNTETEPVGRCVCDFISGMTDRYAIETYKDLFIPKVWKG